MKHAIECINKGTGCNDRGCLDASRDNLEQFTNSINISEYSNDLAEDFPKPQTIIQPEGKISNQNYDTTCIKKLIEVLGNDTTLLSNWHELSESKKFELTRKWVHDNLPNLPDSLAPLAVGLLFPSNDNELMDEIPTWLDRDKFARGQRFACDYLFGIFFAEVLSLFTLFSFEDGLKPLIVTGKSAEPYTAFTRYLSTANRVRNWYTSDPWTKGTAAYNDIKIVKKKHQNVRDKLNELTNKGIDEAAIIDKPWSPSRDTLIEDFKSFCPAARPGQCPYAIDMIRDVTPCALNHGSMAATQFGFFGLTILFPEAFGIHAATDEDLEAFCHVWRGIGFLLGIKDEYNFCRGTLDEIKQRSRDFLDFWVKPNLRNITPEWEHMMRCVSAGLRYYFPGAPYEASLLFFTELLGLEMTKFQASLSFPIKLRHNVTKLIMKYPYRLSSVRKMLNRKLHQSMDHALNFDNEKHVELREKSSKTMSMVSRNKVNNDNNRIDGDKKVPINVTKYSQYKVIGVLMVITHCLILWRVTPISGLL